MRTSQTSLLMVRYVLCRKMRNQGWLNVMLMTRVSGLFSVHWWSQCSHPPAPQCSSRLHSPRETQSNIYSLLFHLYAWKSSISAPLWSGSHHDWGIKSIEHKPRALNHNKHVTCVNSLTFIKFPYDNIDIFLWNLYSYFIKDINSIKGLYDLPKVFKMDILKLWVQICVLSEKAN